MSPSVLQRPVYCRRLPLLLCLGLLLVVCSAVGTRAEEPAAGEGAQLDKAEAEAVITRLRQGVSGFTSLSCTFTQEKTLRVFSRTVSSKGRLSFRRPDALRWEYTSPVASGFVVSGGKGAHWSNAGGVFNSSPLKESREFTALSRQVSLWLTFDEDALREQYTVSVLSANPAILRLVPKSEGIRRFLGSLTLEFAADDAVAKRVHIQESGGDSTLLTFSDAVINAPLGDDLFLPPSGKATP